MFSAVHPITDVGQYNRPQTEQRTAVAFLPKWPDQYGDTWRGLITAAASCCTSGSAATAAPSCCAPGSAPTAAASRCAAGSATTAAACGCASGSAASGGSEAVHASKRSTLSSAEMTR